MSKLSEWSPFDQFVQNGMVDGRFLGSSYTLLAFGAPRLANVGGAGLVASAIGGRAGDQIAMPVGITQGFQLGQNLQVSRFFEIGSYRSVHIPGHAMGQLSLGRPMYHGMSLLRVAYAYYQDLIPKTIIQAGFANIGASTVDNPHDVQLPPGYENFFINLGSDIFKQPVGMLVIFRDSNNDGYGAFYVEAMYAPSHSLSFDAQGVAIMENASFQYERLIPIPLPSIKLITG